jgi:hypothetical protein
MKRIIFITSILLFINILHAKNDTTFYKHEIKASFGGALTSVFWLQNEICFAQFSIAYFYRPVKWFWVGGNFVNFFGEKMVYTWREYDVNGNYNDFSKTNIKYCAVIAPEVRFSYLNKEEIILYGALSGGVGLENGFDSKWQKYPRVFPYFQVTYFGISGNFGINNDIFFGGELGVGYKGLCNIHVGYRF